ncbi:MAG: SPW repeat protein [Burkholderiales bacterium]
MQGGNYGYTESAAGELEIALGIWLIATPWLLGYAEPFGPAAASAGVIGFVVLLYSLDDYFFTNEADEWVDGALGIGLMLSPVLLGYTDNTRATLNAVFCGFLITGIAAWAVQRLHAPPCERDRFLPHF